MNPLLLFLSLLLSSCLIFQVEAQGNFTPEDIAPSTTDVSKVNSSLGIVVGVLFVMFSLTFVLLIYVKYWRTGSFVYRGPNLLIDPALLRSPSRFSGIDRTVIDSLPFFKFSSLKGSKQGLECSVCLSKFEDIEILRLLPKCKHAFHINCIDQWLEKHSSCPLCRFKVNIEDPTSFTYTNSMRLLIDERSELRQDSNVEIFVQREAGSPPSSRFGSFRKMIKQSSDKEEEVLIQEDDDEKKILHKFNHKIVVSDVIFKNRWSSASSSDLMFLKSEMLNSMSSNRFSTTNMEPNDRFPTIRVIDHENEEEMIQIKEEMEMKRLFESKVGSSSNINNNKSRFTSRTIDPTERRSVSEITGRSRFQDLSMKNRIRDSSFDGNERARKIWFEIARRTVQWFADRERRSQQQQQSQMNTTTATQPSLLV